MGLPNCLPTEIMQLLAVWSDSGAKPHITVANSEKVSESITLGSHDVYLAVITLGDMANETIDVRLEADTASNFSTSKTTIKAATQLAASASANDNKIIFLIARAEDIESTLAGANYLRARAITGNSTGGVVGCQIWGLFPRFMPVSTHANVVETAVAG